MRLTASKLRADIYRILDQVAETGRPVEIVRNGRILRIVSAEAEKEEPKAGKLGRLVAREIGAGDPEEFVHLDWSSEWKE